SFVMGPRLRGTARIIDEVVARVERDGRLRLRGAAEEALAPGLAERGEGAEPARPGVGPERPHRGGAPPAWSPCPPPLHPSWKWAWGSSMILSAPSFARRSTRSSVRRSSQAR